MHIREMATWLPLCLLGLTTAAQAQRGEPCSLLLFAEYDTQGGLLNLITVTNTDASADIETNWVYVDEDCMLLDRSHYLAGGDTLTVLSSAHNPNIGRGYLYVYAVDLDTGEPVVHDHLIGTSTTLDGLGVLDYTVEPFCFVGVGAEGTLTDLDADGVRDLDGIEYGKVADEMLVPRFFGQTASLVSKLVLLDLSGGRGFVTDVNITYFNDNSGIFSASHTFSCWTRVALLDIAPGFSNAALQATHQDHDEVIGAPEMEAGWMRLNGGGSTNGTITIGDPAIVCLLVDHAGRGASVHAFAFGEQGNGGLTPSGPDFEDCNDNGVPDAVDIASGTSGDCNQNDVPDECDPDLDQNGYPDDCQPIAPDDVSFELTVPSSHDYYPIDLYAVAGVIDPQDYPFTIVVTAITQDEPIDGPGSGNTLCDATGLGSALALIRAERSGRGDGRVYAVHYTATNAIGAPTNGMLTVEVPHSQNGQPAVDSGQLYDSTEGCP